jgi:hypothetical protein
MEQTDAFALTWSTIAATLLFVAGAVRDVWRIGWGKAACPALIRPDVGWAVRCFVPFPITEPTFVRGDSSVQTDAGARQMIYVS